MKPVQLLPGAQRDFDEAIAWYAERSPMAAERFLSALGARLNEIAAGPCGQPFIDSIHQSCSLLRFPFQIIFRQHQGEILVVAIAHAKRRPGFWSRRKNENEDD